MGLRDLNPFYTFKMEEPFLDQYSEGDKVSFIVVPMVQIYFREDSGYGVYEVEEEQEHRRFNISGTFLQELHMSSYYRITGTIATFKGQRQVKIDQYSITTPQTEEAIINVLRTLHGLNTKAHLLYDVFGADVLELIKRDPERVAASIKGVGLRMAQMWQAQLLEDVEQTEALVALTEYGLSLKQATTLFRKFGPIICDKLKNSPYFLLEEVSKLTFQKCDKIALTNSFPLDGYDRIMEAMATVLRRALGEENCYMTAEEFVQNTSQLLNISLEASECETILSSNPNATGTVLYQTDNYAIPVNIDDLRVRIKTMSADDVYQVFSVNKSYLDTFLDMNRNGKVVRRTLDGNDLYMLSWIDNCEDTIAKCALNFTISCWGNEWPVETILQEYLNETGWTLEAKQQQAVLTMARQKGGIYILNGAAGCGKTFTLNIIIKVLKMAYERDGLPFCAKIMTPTGKAAQVAGKATGLEAQTIHRAIGLTSDSSDPDSDKLHGVDCIIIDEFSMVDIRLASKLFSAIGGAVKVILVGDTEQLPSIGPGAVLRDFIQSGQIPTITLDVVKRQAQNSGILKNATRIVAGEMIQKEVSDDPSVPKDGDAYVIAKSNPYEVQEEIARFVERQIRTKAFKLEDLQVLCPQKGTPIGTTALNYRIQQALNPKVDGMQTVQIGKTKLQLSEKEKETEVILEFREGDKVIHIKNNYDVEWHKFNQDGHLVRDYEQQGIVNGEMGIVLSISEYKDNKVTKKRMLVQYEKGCIYYEGDLLDEITLAYAMTIHKSQGSQWPLVVSPIMRCNWYMLNRKLLYTMYTRAQKVSIVIGESRAIQHAIDNTSVANRNTLLKERLNGTPLI